MLAQQFFRKSRDLLALEEAVLSDTALALFQPHVRRGVAPNPAGRNDENVATESVSSVDRNDQSRPLLTRRLSGDGNPVQTAPSRKGIQFQVFRA